MPNVARANNPLTDEWAVRSRLLKECIPYLMPEITRGPANKDWLDLMKRIAKELMWGRCPLCGGTGCQGCLFVGYQIPSNLR